MGKRGEVDTMSNQGDMSAGSNLKLPLGKGGRPALG
jgi:hypothetical protein